MCTSKQTATNGIELKNNRGLLPLILPPTATALHGLPDVRSHAELLNVTFTTRSIRWRALRAALHPARGAFFLRCLLGVTHRVLAAPALVGGPTVGAGALRLSRGYLKWPRWGAEILWPIYL